jgi:hypothetical protein
MTDKPRLGVIGFLFFLAIVLVAGAVRGRYIATCLDASSVSIPLEVQDPPAEIPSDIKLEPILRAQPNELDLLVYNLKEHHWFGAAAPLSKGEEKTAHVAPGYPWLLAQLAGWIEDSGTLLQTIRWTQCALGALTAGLYFLFTFAAFRSWWPALLAGLLCAVHPFWVFNAAEVNDGVVVTFLLALTLVLGMRGSQDGGAFVSLLFGLTSAGLAMVRAALLPFTVVSCLWYVSRCRSLPRGWLCAVLAVLGYANGLAPWIVRNAQAFHEPIPVSDSMYLHLWIGNNVNATGGPQDETKMHDSLSTARLEELRAEENQARRYGMLAQDLLKNFQPKNANDDSALVRGISDVIGRRLWAGLYFFFGEAWFDNPSRLFHSEFYSAQPAIYPLILNTSLLGMILLGAFGWRWTYGWRQTTRLAALALVWIPLPYLLSHAEQFSGPRLPLDGILLSFSAFAICYIIPKAGDELRRGAQERG